MDRLTLINLIASQILIAKSSEEPVELNRISCGNAKMEAEYILECLERDDEQWDNIKSSNLYVLGSF